MKAEIQFMSLSHITLVVPGLFESLSRRDQLLPRYQSLEIILTKADRSSNENTSYHRDLMKQFDIDLKTPGCAAAVSRFADTGKRDNQIWMQLTPVFLNADKDRLMLQGQSMLSITRQEADSLVRELNNCYKDDDFQFEAGHPERWYVRLPELPESTFSDYLDVLGRNIEPFMPSGSDQGEWRCMINEMQMLLHSTEINQQRQECSHYPVNSVWCWGEGKIPQTVNSHWRSIYTNEIFCKGLAKISETDVYDLPDHADKLFENIQRDGFTGENNQLIVIQQSEENILSLDFEHYTQRLAELERGWFKPLLNRLVRGEIESMTFTGGDGFNYKLQKKHLRRFWRKRISV
ncbi:MAG: hypothetical protein GXP13_02280 [Gammaproteobacteria bacterium]|nr:hypothetical protein [Gammaproteobacteria bacterium]